MSSLNPEEFDAPILASVPLAELHTGEEGSAPTGGVSRRTLVKVAAWSAPVIAIAVGAPAAAASPNEPATNSGILVSVTDPALGHAADFTGQAVATFFALPSGKYYQPGFVITVTSPTQVDFINVDPNLSGPTMSGTGPYVYTFVVGAQVPSISLTAIPRSDFPVLQTPRKTIDFRIFDNNPTQIGSASATPKPNPDTP